MLQFWAIFERDIDLGEDFKANVMLVSNGSPMQYLFEFLLNLSGADDKRAADGVLQLHDVRVDVLRRDCLRVGGHGAALRLRTARETS